MNQKAWFAYERGYVAFHNYRLRDALRDFKEALDWDPNLVSAYRGVASTLVKLKKYEQGRQAYLTYVQKEKNTSLPSEAKALLGALK